jgi:hypothetical protein
VRELPTPANTSLQFTTTKVGKSDGEGTFAGVRGNDEVAPTAVIGATTIENARWIFLSLDYLVGTPR